MLIYLTNTTQKELVNNNEEKWEYITQSGARVGLLRKESRHLEEGMT